MVEAPLLFFPEHGCFFDEGPSLVSEKTLITMSQAKTQNGIQLGLVTMVKQKQKLFSESAATAQKKKDKRPTNFHL
jgi:hypothetical protein